MTGTQSSLASSFRPRGRAGIPRRRLSARPSGAISCRQSTTASPSPGPACRPRHAARMAGTLSPGLSSTYRGIAETRSKAFRACRTLGGYGLSRLRSLRATRASASMTRSRTSAADASSENSATGEPAAAAAAATLSARPVLPTEGRPATTMSWPGRKPPVSASSCGQGLAMRPAQREGSTNPSAPPGKASSTSRALTGPGPSGLAAVAPSGLRMSRW